MVDTLWADISEFQRPVNDSYPHQILAIRSNDGTYRDHNFAANRGWCDRAVASGKLAAYIVYYFWRPGGTGLATCRSQVGTPNPRMALMIDVEAGSGAHGDQSSEINAEHDEAARWLGNQARVIGYGNTGDLNSLWPRRPAGMRLVIAAYGGNPSYPGKFAHQYTDSGTCPPFGTCDMNSADGMSLTQVTATLGIGAGVHAAAPAPAPAAHVVAGTAPAWPGRTLTQGVRGADVSQWQGQMAHRGWRITVDGVYGPASANICRQFQQEKHLAVDGEVGPVTWRASWEAPLQ